MTTFEYYKLSIFENKLMIYMLIFLLSSAGNIASIYYKAVMHNQKPVYFKVLLKKTVRIKTWMDLLRSLFFPSLFSSTAAICYHNQNTASRICSNPNYIQ